MRDHQLVGLGIFFPSTSTAFFTGGSNDSTGTGGDQDDASLDQGLGQFSDGHASLATRWNLIV